MPSSKVLEAIAVTAELCGRTFSSAAAMVFCGDLEGFEDAALLKALARCRKEVRGALTVQDVVSRVDDGRPGPEEAWAMLPRDEETSVVWTSEMAVAWGLVRHMIGAGEEVPARMAFKESYIKAVTDARDKRMPPTWLPCLGHDQHGRAAALNQAVELGRLPAAHVAALLPAPESAASVGNFLLTGDARPLLVATPPTEREIAKQHIANLQAILAKKGLAKIKGDE